MKVHGTNISAMQLGARDGRTGRGGAVAAGRRLRRDEASELNEFYSSHNNTQ